MKTLKCRFVQNRLPAFINHECSVREKRIIGQHLDQCTACNATYHQQRRTQQEIKRDLPRIGMPSQVRLAAIWEQVEQEITMPQPKTRANRAITSPLSVLQVSWHYALVAVMAMVMLMVPWVVDSHPVHAAVPSQPAPVDVVEARLGTPWHDQDALDATEVAFATHADTIRGSAHAVLHNTPPQTPEPANTQK